MKKNIKILIVEDSKTQAEELKYFLETNGYMVQHANDGEEALSMLKQNVPDIIISDVVMPKIGGYELCKRIKSDENFKKIPIILITSLSGHEEIFKSLECGADSFITKPYSEDFLITKVKDIILRIESKEDPYTESSVEIVIDNNKYLIGSSRLQIVDLLLSTNENAVLKSRELDETNKELVITQHKLNKLNENLEEKVKARTQRIEHLNAVLSAIRNVNQLIVQEKDRKTLIKKACENFVEVRDFQSAWIALLDDDGKIMDFAGEGFGENIPEIDNQFLHDYTPHCVEEVLKIDPIFLLEDKKSDCKNCPRLKYHKESENGSVVLNLKYGGKNYGILNVALPARYINNKEEQSLFIEIAEDIAFALYNMEMEEKRKQTEKAIIFSNERFQNIAESSGDWIWETDKEGRFTYCSPFVKQVLGYEYKEMLGKYFYDFFSPDIKEELKNSALEAFAQKQQINNLINENIHKDSRKVILETSCVPVLDDKGNLSGYRGVDRDITKRKQAEKALLESEMKFRFAMHNSPIGMALVAPDGRWLDVNNAICNIIGYTKEELSLRDFQSVTYPDDLEKDLNFVKQMLNRELEKYQMEKRYFHKDGRVIWILLNVSLVWNDDGTPKYFISQIQDITNRKRTEQIQKVLYNISNAVITTDNLKKLIKQIKKELGTIIDITNFFVALYDQETDTLSLPFFTDEKDKISSFPAGKTMTKYVINTRKSLLVTSVQQEKLVEKGDIEFVGSRSKIWLGVPLKIEGKVTGVLAIQSYTDENAYTKSDMKLLEFVSDQISISIDRKKAEEDLKNTLVKATESDRLKSAFLATMSHELRTPLNAIIGFSDIINEDVPIVDIMKFNKTINTSGTHLLSIVEDLFNITLIEAGEIRIVKEDVKLKSILNDVQEIIKIEQQKIDKNHLDLNLRIPTESSDLTLNTDASKLKQILINLLKNALKFTHEGHVCYGFEIETIQDKPTLKFCVEDTGIGIPKDKQELIFDAFRQVEETNTKTYGGTGIGLSISKKLTELLGGKIWLESEEGKGSNFYFTIPLEGSEIVDKPTEIEPEVEVKTESYTKKKSKFKKKTILIVEDVEPSFEFLKAVLKKSGIKTLWANNGKTAVKYCNETPDIDLVLMDINMPIMNGYEATKEIKKFKPDLPIIAQTAYAIAGDRQKSLDAGCNDYISKPIKKDELLAIIGKYIN